MTNQVANTILAQLGGSKFLAMTGASVYSDTNALIIKLPRYRAITITLTPADLYDVVETKMNSRTCEIKKKDIAQGIYADMLQSTFTEATGLLCTL